MNFFAYIFLAINLIMVKCMATESKLRDASITSGKIKEMNLNLRYIDYFGYDYDYGYYGTSYRCHPNDYECNNFGYDFGGYHRK